MSYLIMRDIYIIKTENTDAINSTEQYPFIL